MHFLNRGPQKDRKGHRSKAAWPRLPDGIEIGKGNYERRETRENGAILSRISRVS